MMTRLKTLLALVVLLWGAPTLADEHGDAGNGAASSAASESAQDDAADGAAQEAGDAAAGEEAAEAEGEEGAEAEGEVAGGAAAEGVRPWTFTGFDRDNDGFVTQEEFSRGLTQLVAGEQGVDQARFEETVQMFGLGAEATDFETADVNQDQVIAGQEEFGPAIAETLFSKWDEDGDSQLTAAEFSSNMFSAFDVNADGNIDAQEFEPLARWIEQDIEGVAGGGAEITQNFFTGEARPYATPAESPEAGAEGDVGGGGAAEPGAEDDALDGDEAEDGPEQADDAAGVGAEGEAEDIEEPDAPSNGEDPESTEDPADAPN